MKIPDQIVMSAELRTELETMPATALAAMSIADLKELGLGPVAALALRNAATSSAAVAVEEADPCMVVLQRLAGASAPSARLAAEAETIHTGCWLVLSAEGKVTVEASAAELRRLRRALPEREVTTDGLRVVTPSRWAAVTAETVLIHPWKDTPLEDDGTDPHSGVSWMDEQLWLPATSGILPPGYEWVADTVDLSHFLLVDERGRVRAAVRGWTDGRGGWGSTMLVGSWPEPALAMAATVGAMERAGWELRTVVIDPAAATAPLTSSESPSG